MRSIFWRPHVDMFTNVVKRAVSFENVESSFTSSPLPFNATRRDGAGVNYGVTSFRDADIADAVLLFEESLRCFEAARVREERGRGWGRSARGYRSGGRRGRVHCEGCGCGSRSRKPKIYNRKVTTLVNVNSTRKTAFFNPR